MKAKVRRAIAAATGAQIKRLSGATAASIELEALPGLNLVPQQRIPRIVHQTFRKLPLPEVFEDCVSELRSGNPDWEFKLYDDSECEAFVHEHYGAKVLALYSLVRPEYGVAKADLFRYLAVYRFGGTYFDIKSGASAPLDGLLRDDGKIWLSRWRSGPGQMHEGWGLHPELASCGGHELVQWFLAAPPGHPYLRAVILSVLNNLQAYSPWRLGIGSKGVLRTTGPIAFTRAIYPLLPTEQHVLCDGPDELGLIYSRLDRSGERRHVIGFGKGHYTQQTGPIADLRGWHAWGYPLWRLWRSATWRFRD